MWSHVSQIFASIVLRTFILSICINTSCCNAKTNWEFINPVPILQVTILQHCTALVFIICSFLLVSNVSYQTFYLTIFIQVWHYCFFFNMLGQNISVCCIHIWFTLLRLRVFSMFMKKSMVCVLLYADASYNQINVVYRSLCSIDVVVGKHVYYLTCNFAWIKKVTE